MRDTDLFQAALGLSSPWFVVGSDFDPERKQLDIQIGFRRGSRFACPACGAEGCGVHDVKEKEWRHLNFFQHETVLKASVPRVSCDECGVKQVLPPWAREGSGFTLLFEAFLLSMAKAMPVANVAEIVDEHDTRIWRVLDHYISRAVERLDLSEVTQIAADETSARRGHDYISLFVDMARRKVVYVTDGKDAATVDAFATFLEARGGRRENITDASIDMGAAFIAGVKANFPNAKITFDKFHVIKLVNEAVDEVRRAEAKHNNWIKGTRYLWLKNLENLDEEEKASIVRLEAANLDTMQAWQIRLNLQDVFTMPSVASARKFLSRWYAWVSTCDLAPMQKAASTIMAKADDILRSIGNNLSNGLLEAINGNVQAAKRKAKGYRTKHNLKLMVYLIAGGVLDALPT
jgi:transposase